MTLLEEIRNDMIKARKENQVTKATFLATLYSEASMIGKNDSNRESTDIEVLNVIKSFLKGINDTLNIIDNIDSKYFLTKSRLQFIVEKKLLEYYMPIQLTGDSLKEVIHNIIKDKTFCSVKDMGKVMKILKDSYPCQYEGKEASDIAKNILINRGK